MNIFINSFLMSINSVHYFLNMFILFVNSPLPFISKMIMSTFFVDFVYMGCTPTSALSTNILIISCPWVCNQKSRNRNLFRNSERRMRKGGWEWILGEKHQLTTETCVRTTTTYDLPTYQILIVAVIQRSWNRTHMLLTHNKHYGGVALDHWTGWWCRTSKVENDQ